MLSSRYLKQISPERGDNDDYDFRSQDKFLVYKIFIDYN